MSNFTYYCFFGIGKEIYMKQDNNNIPTRKGVHFRNTSSNTSNAVKKSSASQSNAKTHTSPAKTNDRQKISKPIQKKTPAELSHEKELYEREQYVRNSLKQELKTAEKLKAERKKQQLTALKSHYKTALFHILIGLAIALAAGLIIAFIYYRSLSKYPNNEKDYSVQGYNYINQNDTSESNLEKIKARQNGTESPCITLSEKLLIKDNIVYLPYSEISDYFNLTISGDDESRTVIVGTSQTEYTSENSVVFNFGTGEISVNGSIQILENAPLLKDNELYIPYEFFETFVKGIAIENTVDENKTDIKITKTLENVYFSGSSNTPIESPNIGSYVNEVHASYEYSFDLSEYEKYINPDDKDKYLTLVNLNNKLAPDYVPDDLIDVTTRADRQAQQMRYDAANALEAMLRALSDAGHGDVSVTSAYRSYSYQNSIFNTRLQENLRKYDAATAEAKTAEFTMYPGASEHQSGLCVDMHNLSSAMQSFANEEAYKWLIEHCADFGFIIRYPQSKEDITGIKFEPWHYRFVGRYHAQKIMSEGLSLEEYVERYYSASTEQ